MFSGDDLTFPERVLHLMAQDAGTWKRGECNRPKMEGTVKKAFEACWNREVEDQVLKPNLLSIASFTAEPRDIRLLDSKFLNQVSAEIADYKHNCSMLFCGFDDNGPHIFVASTPCRIDPCDWQGFQAIGAGEETARNHLIWSEYDKDDSLESVLYDVFNAKVATEVLQGIGYAWNWKVIVKGRKPQALPKRIDALIDKVWEAFNRSPYGSRRNREDRTIRTWKRRLETFSETLLRRSR